MVDVLRLSDGTTDVDFILATSDYSLVPDGISMPPPDAQRVVGGDPQLREGQRLIERQYSNREIGITFHIEAASHDALLEDIRTIVRLIDTAKDTARDGFGPKVTLAYNLTNATDQMIFDVLDGTLDLGDIAGELVRRKFQLLRTELTLICQPYARLAAPLEIHNELINPGFDWNPGEGGRDGGSTVDFEASADSAGGVASNKQPTGTPPVMSCGVWVNMKASPGADEFFIHVGETTFSWALGIASDEKPFFEYEESDSTPRRLNANSTIPVTGGATDWRFVGVTLFTVDGTELYAALMIGDQNGIVVDSFSRLAAPLTFKVPTIFMALGATATPTSGIDGLMTGAFIIVNRQILPYQLAYIYKHGMRGLVSADVMDDKYWGFKKEELAGVWLFDEVAGSLSDSSANSNALALTGSPARALQIAKPKGWTLGANLLSSLTSGLYKTDVRHGTHAMVIEEAADSATRVLTQIIATNREAGKVTLVLWVRGRTAGELDIRVKLEAAESYIVISSTLNEWKQFIITDTVSSGPTKQFEIRTGASGATDVIIDSVMYIPGHPFGERGGGGVAVDVTDELLPFIGAKEMIALPDGTKVNHIEIEDIPGDAPATCKVKLKNTSTKPMSPVRIGMSSGKNPWKRELAWRASLFAPIFGNDTNYGSGADPTIDGESSVTVVDRFQASLASLFPFPTDQVGSHRMFVAVQSEQNMYSFFRMVNESVALPISGDPVKDINSDGTNIHVVDGGIINWPPELALTEVRDNKITSRPRQDRLFPGPKLTIANIADNADVGIIYEHVFALPVDAGFFSLMAAVASEIAGLQDGEELVVDTIDEEAVGYGYIQEFVDVPSEAGAGFGGVDLVSGGSSDLALFGVGFMLQPRKSNVLVVQVNEHALANDILFGRFTKTATFEVIVEYMPRFLYV